MYKLKAIDGSKEPWDPPKRYIGGYCGYYEISNRTKAWYMSSDSYAKITVKTIESQLAEQDKHLTRTVKPPLTSGYQPDIDVS